MWYVTIFDGDIIRKWCLILGKGMADGNGHPSDWGGTMARQVGDWGNPFPDLKIFSLAD